MTTIPIGLNSPSSANRNATSQKRFRAKMRQEFGATPTLWFLTPEEKEALAGFYYDTWGHGMGLEERRRHAAGARSPASPLPRTVPERGTDTGKTPQGRRAQRAKRMPSPTDTAQQSLLNF